MAPSGTIVSLFRSSRVSPSEARIPMLFAAANPRLAPASMTRALGHCRAALALSSVEALSTTMISWVTRGGGSCNDARQRVRCARVLKLTMMIESAGMVRPVSTPNP